MEHFALPLQVTPSGALATLPQDSPAEVTQAVAVLVSTLPGERRSVPDYGLPSPLFDGFDPSEAADVIEEWEPRADPVLMDQLVDGVVEIWDLTVGTTTPAINDEGSEDL